MFQIFAFPWSIWQLKQDTNVLKRHNRKRRRTRKKNQKQQSKSSLQSFPKLPFPPELSASVATIITTNDVCDTTYTCRRYSSLVQRNTMDSTIHSAFPRRSDGVSEPNAIPIYPVLLPQSTYERVIQPGQAYQHAHESTPKPYEAESVVPATNF